MHSGSAKVEGYEAIFTSKQLKNKIVEGKLNVTLSLTQIPETYPRNEGDEVTYEIDIYNPTNVEKSNVIVTMPLPEGLEFVAANKSGIYNANTKAVNWNLNTIGGKNRITLYITAKVSNLPNNLYQRTIEAKVNAKTGDFETSSNKISFNVCKAMLSVKQTSETSQEVKVGDNIVYNVVIENVGTGIAQDVNIETILSEGLSFESAECIRKGQTYFLDKKMALSGIDAKEKIEITITAVAEELDEGALKKEVSNIIKVNAKGMEEILSNKITNKVVPASAASTDDPSTDVIEEGTYSISGIAWIDANNNGKREDEEERLKDIKVMLINAENGQIVTDISTGKEKVQQTSENGSYIFSNLKPGTYMVIFFHDTKEYGVAIYRQAGVASDRNSDVVVMNVQMNGETNQAGVSDKLEISSQDITNIDMGVVKNPKFDLKLDKVISKITVTDSKGTKTHEYKDTKLAKLDLEAKKVNGTTIMIEYKIRVTNEGAIAGYAKKIVDYLPQDMKFSSELNKDWYTGNNGTNLYNASLANTLIAPGETKEITLLLTKKMTNNNTGIINNVAEIAESYNELGLVDFDSTPANKVQGEDDTSNADAIIGTKTGEIYIYITLTLITISILGVGIYMINKKVLKKE